MMNTTPTHEQLQALVGRAIVDQAFCRDLLNGHRAECLSQFDLSADERSAANAIQAHDLSSFARELNRWIHDQAPRANVTATLASTRQLPMLAAVA